MKTLSILKNLTIAAIISALFIAALCVSYSLGGGYALAEESNGMTVEKNSEKYGSSSFRNTFGIFSDDITSTVANGDSRDTYVLSNAFDNKSNTFWVSEKANSDTFKNSITVQFKQPLDFKGFTYKSSYYSVGSARNFSGYPTTLKVFAANGDDNYALAGICVSTPQKDVSEDVVFLLENDVLCDRIILEFTEVSVYSKVFDGAAVATACDIMLFKRFEGIIPTVRASGNLGNKAFLEANSVALDDMSVRTNGNGTVKNAFDKSEGSFWKSDSENNDIFKNKIIIGFKESKSLDGIVFHCNYFTRPAQRYYTSFPVRLKVTATAEDGAETQFLFAGRAPVSETWGYAECSFPRSVRCNRLILEFQELSTFPELEEGAEIANFSEIYIVNSIVEEDDQEEMAQILESVNAIFTDYAQYELKEEFSTAESIGRLREKAKGYKFYETSVKPIIDRAEAIARGSLKKDIYREFSTDPNAKNSIEQNGDLKSYCRNTLQLTSFGTNRQVIGVGGTSGETITIYVEAEENDPLPSVAFTQIYGAWNSWMREYKLHLGKNEIVFPNFKSGGGYSRAIEAGGPIHIVNPYTPEQQSSNVKMYIEGGYIYPVFHDGDDEGTFKIILDNYYKRLKDPADKSITIDAFEAVAGNVILSCTASLAYNSYVTRGTSPQNNINAWDKYLVDSLKFGGIVFDPDKQYYDERNLHIKANYRIVQPYAGFYAFAANEHIGIIDSGTFPAMTQKWTLGWAFAHELGHMLDNMRMKHGEVTNNMWSIFNIYMVDGSFNDRIRVTNVANNLASDFSGKVKNFYGNGNDNCDFWWIIEGARPGYWARLQQLYAFEYSDAVKDPTERLCYYSSLAIGEDLTEYFERWGFYFTSGNYNSGNRFAASKVSDAFKTAMSAAVSDGRIKGNASKFWYVNNDQYRYTRLHGGTITADWASCYSDADTVNISSIMSADGVNTLILPTPDNAEAHLCYEVQSYIDNKWQVLGVTYGSGFTDRYDYGDVTPRYRVYAYDRMFNRTGDGDEKSPVKTTQSNVCRINDVYYNSLKEAVAAARDNDIIYLVKDFFDGDISIAKRITILPEPGLESVTVTKNSSGHLFKISANVKFGSEQQGAPIPTSAPIILDGNGFLQNGALIFINACTVTLNNVVLQNNYSTGVGGAVYVEYNANLYINGCVIRNNRASDGGGIFLNGRSNISVRGLELKNNVASNRGGGLYEREYTGTSNFHNRDKVKNAYPDLIISGNRASYGGAIYTENNVELYGAQITDNTATVRGGAVYTDIDNTGRAVRLNNCTVSGNAPNAVYMNRGMTEFNGGVISGVIYKAYGTNPQARFGLKTSLPDFSGAQIQINKDIPDDGLTLCESVSGMGSIVDTLTEAVKNWPILNGRAEFVSGVGICIYPKKVELSLSVNGKTLKADVSMGNFVLPERVDALDENQYIVKYTIGGVEHAVGDKISVTGQLTAVAQVDTYARVDFKYNEKTDSALMRKGIVYYLPMRTPDGEMVFGWHCSDGNYYAYAEAAEITGDVTFTADVKKLYSLVLSYLGNDVAMQYEYGRSITLSAPPAVLGKAFNCWVIDGKKYEANQSVRMTTDITAVAEYTDTWQVTTYVDEEESVKTVVTGAVLLLPYAEPRLGRELKYWLVNGVKYYAGSECTINCDTEISAVFTQIIPDTVNITLVVNKGQLPDASDDDIVENETTVLTYKHNQAHVFSQPEVNDGNKFLYWNVNGVRFEAGSSIYVTEAFTAIAEVVPESEASSADKVVFTVKDFIDGAANIRKTEFDLNEEIIIAEPINDDTDKTFSYWMINGNRYNVGDVIVATENMDAVAIYDNAEEFSVVVRQYVNGVREEKTLSLKAGAIFTLQPHADAPESSDFMHWKVNGIDRKVGEEIVVMDDIFIDAVYDESKPVDTPTDSDVGNAVDNNKSNVGLIVGLSAAAVVMIAAAIAVFVILRKRKVKATVVVESNKPSDEEPIARQNKPKIAKTPVTPAQERKATTTPERKITPVERKVTPASERKATTTPERKITPVERKVTPVPERKIKPLERKTPTGTDKKNTDKK